MEVLGWQLSALGRCPRCGWVQEVQDEDQEERVHVSRAGERVAADTEMDTWQLGRRVSSSCASDTQPSGYGDTAVAAAAAADVVSGVLFWRRYSDCRVL